MTIEPFVYLALFLMVALIVFVTRWLKREIEKESDGESVPAVLPNDRQGSGQPRQGEPFIPADEELSTSDLLSVPGQAPRMLPGRWRRHLRTSSTLRYGVMLITILGPCRAVDQRNEPPHI